MDKLNPRLQLVTIRPNVTTPSKIRDGKMGKLFGTINVSDQYGFCADGWCQMGQAECGYVSLFGHNFSDAQNVFHGGVFDIGDPSSSNLVPFGPSMQVLMELFICTEENDECIRLFDNTFKLTFSNFWDRKLTSLCVSKYLKGDEGFLEMNYILLADAVDVVVECEFNNGKRHGRKAFGSIHSSLTGGFDYGCDQVYRGCYTPVLYRPSPESILETGPLKLMRSVLAVPVNGTLKIEILFVDSKTHTPFLQGEHEFKALTKGRSCARISDKRNKKCYVDVRISWKYPDGAGGKRVPGES